MSNRLWTQNEINFLKSHYLKCTFTEIAKRLNRSYLSISAKTNKLGLYRQGIKNIKPPENLSEVERAYLAGFIDADGSIRMSIVSKNSILLWAVPVVEISNSDTKILDWIANKVNWSGRWKTKTPYKKEENRYLEMRSHYHLTISGQLRLKPFLEAISPYLRVKRANAEKILEFFKQRRERFRQAYSIEDWKLVLEIRELINSFKAPHIRSRQHLAQFIKELETKKSKNLQSDT